MFQEKSVVHPQEKIFLQQQFEKEKISRARKFKTGENVLEQQKK